MATQDTTGGTTLPRNNGATIVYGGNIDNSGTVTNAPSTTIFGRPKTARGHNMPIGGQAEYDGDIDEFDGPSCVRARQHTNPPSAGHNGMRKFGGIFAYNPPANAPPGGRFVAMRVSTTLNAPAPYQDPASSQIGYGSTPGSVPNALMFISGGGRSIGQYRDNTDGSDTLARAHVQAHGVGAHVADIPQQYPLPYANPTQIHFKEGSFALGVNTWNYVTGAITKGGTAGNRYLYHHASLSAHTDAVSGGGGTLSPNATDRAARAKTNGGCGGWDVHPGRVTYNHGGYVPTSTYYNGVVWRGPGRSA